jgi:hypothetical protein
MSGAHPIPCLRCGKPSDPTGGITTYMGFMWPDKWVRWVENDHVLGTYRMWQRSMCEDCCEVASKHITIMVGMLIKLGVLR